MPLDLMLQVKLVPLGPVDYIYVFSKNRLRVVPY